MNSDERYKNDALRCYIKPENREKAPERFTTEVMSRIQFERIPLKANLDKRNRNLVPAISTAVTLLLIVSAFLIPGDGSGLSALPLSDFINNLKITLPVFDLTSIFNLTLPSSVIYIFIGIMLVTLFDRALNTLFHRGNN